MLLPQLRILILMMQQSLPVIFFAALLIFPTTLATPFQQFYTNSHSSEIHNDYPPNNLVEVSYDGGDATADSSNSTPVSVADNSSMERLPGTENFLLPSPPSWQGIDNNIAPQFTCKNSDPYCCTGKYIRRKGWVLGPCELCSYHFPPPPFSHLARRPKKTDLCVSDSPKTYECHQLSNLYCCAYLSAVRYAFLLRFCLLIAWPDCGRNRSR